MQDMNNMQVLPPSDDEQVTREKMRDKLPKFTLGRNEGFYIPRETIKKLQDSYLDLLADMNAGKEFLPEELRSYMESVIFTSYVSEIEKKQRDNCLECEVERIRVDNLISLLMPRHWRKWYWPFKKISNQAEILLNELINRQARSYYSKKERELPVLEDEESELNPYEVQLETLRAYLPRMRKKRRFILEEIISGLAASFEGKDAKLQRYNTELQAEKEKVEELTAELKKEAVKRLIICLNSITAAKESAELEAKELEVSSSEEEPAEEDEETDELEYWGDDEPEEEFDDENDSE